MGQELERHGRHASAVVSRRGCAGDGDHHEYEADEPAHIRWRTEPVSRVKAAKLRVKITALPMREAKATQRPRVRVHAHDNAPKHAYPTT